MKAIDGIEAWVNQMLPDWLVPIAFELFLTLVFLVVVFLISRHREKKFWKRVEEREAGLADISLSTGSEVAENCESALVAASIVVGQGHFRRFVAALRKLVGGEIRSYGDLHERARREAVNRMKEEARLLGADQVINVRFTTSGLLPLDRPGGLLAVEITAYGTAISSRRF